MITKQMTPSSEQQALLMTIRSSCKALCVGRSTLGNLIANGELRTVRIGRAVRVPVSEIERFVDSKLAASASA